MRGLEGSAAQGTGESGEPVQSEDFADKDRHFQVASVPVDVLESAERFVCELSVWPVRNDIESSD